MENIDNLLDYIQRDFPNLESEISDNKKIALESYIRTLISKMGKNPEFVDLLGRYGWNGHHFNDKVAGKRFNLKYLYDGLQSAHLRTVRFNALHVESPGMNDGNGPGIGSHSSGPTTKGNYTSLMNSETMDGLFSFRLGLGSGNTMRQGNKLDANDALNNELKLSRQRDNLTIQSYCPDVLFKSMQGRTLEPSSVYFSGACILVDISGFTKLSNSFCLKGSAGLDDLHKATNDFLGHFADTIYKYGGDVIAFAGDALVCIFQDPGIEVVGSNCGTGASGNGSGKSTAFHVNVNAPGTNEAVGGVRAFSPVGTQRQLPAFKEIDEKSAAESSKGTAIPVTAPVREDSGVAKPPLGLRTSGKTDHGTSPKRSTACLHAVACAWELKGHCTSKLSVHIGISCGEMSFALLGGYKDKWTYLLNGSCIPELSACIDNAGPKEVCVTNALYELITPSLDQSTLKVHHIAESNNWKLEDLRITEKITLRGKRFQNPEAVDLKHRTSLATVFVATPVLDAINMGLYNSSMSEVREVTTMFIKLDSYSTVYHQDPITLQDFFCMVQRCLDDTGGFMRQFLIDDKGCVLIGMWGVPSFSYGNNASRSVACAYNIWSESEPLGHKVSIGITTGNVFCGNVGSFDRHDYVGIGASVNKSARFMSKSKGKVFIDEETYGLMPSADKSALEPGPMLQLKGFTNLVPSYVLGTIMGMDDEAEGATIRVGKGGKKKACIINSVNNTDIEIDNAGGLPEHIYMTLVKQIQKLDDFDRHSMLMKMLESGGSVPSSPMKRISKIAVDKRNSPGFGSSSSLMSPQDSVLGRNDNLTVTPEVSPKAPATSGVLSSLAQGIAQRSFKKSAQDLKSPAKAGRATSRKATHKTRRHSMSEAPGGVESRLNSYGALAAVPFYTSCIDSFNKIQLQDNEEERLNNVSCTLLEGTGGSWEAEAARYFIENSKNSCGRCVWITSRLKDSMVHFGAIRKLFIKLVGVEYLSNELQQKAVFKKLLFTAFDNNPAFTSINMREYMVVISAIFEFKWSDGWANMRSANKDPNVWEAEKTIFYKKPLVRELLLTLLGVVLIQKPSAIVIENAQFMDELSWKCMLSLVNLPVCAALFLAVRRNSNKFYEADLGDFSQNITHGIAQNDAVSPLLSVNMNTPSNTRTPRAVGFIATPGSRTSILQRNTVVTPSGGNGQGATSPFSTVAVNNSAAAAADHLSPNGDGGTSKMNPIDEAETADQKSISNTELLSRERSVVGTLKGALSSIKRRIIPRFSTAVPADSIQEQVSEVVPVDSTNSTFGGNKGGINMSTALLDSYQKLLENKNVLQLVAENMTRDNVKTFLQKGLGIGEIPENVVSIVFELSNGNLYWCRNLLTFIKQKGVDEFFDQMSKGNEAVHTLRLLTIYGFDNLKPQQKVLMKAASVIGEEFYLEMLESILPATFRVQIDSIVDSLVASGLLLCVDYDPPCYAFPSLEICQILHNVMPRSEAMQFHLTLACFIEEHYKESIAHYYRSLSFHFGFCPTRKADAFKYDVLAADQALSRGEYDDALVLIRSGREHACTQSEWKMLVYVINCLEQELDPEILDRNSGENNSRASSFMGSLTKPLSMMFTMSSANLIDSNKVGPAPPVSTDKKTQLSTHVRLALEEIRELRIHIKNALADEKASLLSSVREDSTTNRTVMMKNKILVTGRDAPLIWVPLYVLASRFPASKSGRQNTSRSRGGVLGWFNFLKNGRQNPYEFDESDEEYSDDEDDEGNDDMFAGSSGSNGEDFDSEYY